MSAAPLRPRLRRLPTLSLALALGCVADDWRVVSSPDAGGADVTPVVDVAPPGDAPPEDVPSRPCGRGFMRCNGSCVAGPDHLYRGDGDARDAVGDADGALRGATFDRGHLGDAFVIDGPYQYVSIPPPVGDFGGGDFTIALWFSSTHQGALLSRRSACWNGPEYAGEDIDLTSEGALAVEVLPLPHDGYFVLGSPRGLDDGRWHHVALMRREATVSLVLDGVVVGTHGVTGSFDDPSGSPSYIGVGRCTPGAPGSNGKADGRPWLNGSVDEVAFFSRALSPDELAGMAAGRCDP